MEECWIITIEYTNEDDNYFNGGEFSEAKEVSCSDNDIKEMIRETLESYKERDVDASRADLITGIKANKTHSNTKKKKEIDKKKPDEVLDNLDNLF